MWHFKNNKFISLYHFSSQRGKTTWDRQWRTGTSQQEMWTREDPWHLLCPWGVGHHLHISIYFTWHDRNPKEREGGKDGIHSRDDEGPLPGWVGALLGGEKGTVWQKHSNCSPKCSVSLFLFLNLNFEEEKCCLRMGTLLPLQVLGPQATISPPWSDCRMPSSAWDTWGAWLLTPTLSVPPRGHPASPKGHVMCQLQKGFLQRVSWEAQRKD